MKTIKIQNIPCGVNVLITNDTGSSQILTEDTIEFDKYYLKFLVL